jgi:hypothetical protein
MATMAEPSVYLIAAYRTMRMEEAAQARLAREARGTRARAAGGAVVALLRSAGSALARHALRRHGDIKSFEQEVEARGIAGRADAGVHTVDTRKIVGSVGRAQTLRSDFFYRRGRAITARYHRVGDAMQRGVELPPLELYKVRETPQAGRAPAASEYYVVDGHHRVAMARKLGQDFLDAHVVEYRLAGTPPTPRSGGEG